MEDITAPDTPQDATAVEPHMETVTGVPPGGPTDESVAKSSGDNVVLRVVYPGDEFAHGVRGVPKSASVITAQGTEVSKSNAEKIKKAAASTAGVELEEVK